jgi:hypothetical protein
MKTLLTALGLLVLPLAAADISGAWKVEGDIADVHVNRVCTIKQTGNKLTGACKNQMNELPMSGEVNGDKVTWTYDADYQGQKVTLVYKGTLESDGAMKGTIATEGAEGSFTAKKQ